MIVSCAVVDDDAVLLLLPPGAHVMMMLVPLLSVQGSAGSSMRPAETVSLRAPKQHAANRITLFAQPTQSRFSPNPHPAVDFGIPTLQQHMRSFRFPWLLSNVLDARTGEPLGGAERSRIIEWQGVKVGLMGLVEREWLLTIPSIDEESIAFRDFCEEGRRLAGELAAQARAGVCCAGGCASGMPRAAHSCCLPLLMLCF